MPVALRRWKPKHKSPLPAPGSLYHELEAAIEFGYTISDWFQEKPLYRAMAIAHSIEKNMREGYTHEHYMKESDGKKDNMSANYPSPMAATWKAWGIDR